MTTTPDPTIIVRPGYLSGMPGSTEVIFEGRRAWLGGTSTASPEAMRARAVDLQKEVARKAFDARRLLAWADAVEAEQAEAEAKAAAERKAKAAATRARRADPFGFEAARKARETEG